MDRIRCVVERITYQNSETGYAVIKVRVKGYADLVTVVGSLIDVVVGSVLTIRGEWKVDRQYGRQLAATSWVESMPADVLGMEKYLGSGLIKGIGPQYAKKIVKQFGIDTFTIIEERPDELLLIEGIGPKRVQKIKEGWEKQKEIKNIMMFLQAHEVSTTFAGRIFKVYGNESIAKMNTNPYQLAEDVWGIGFKTADSIAEKLGFLKDSDVRMQSGLVYTLSELSNEGHMYAEKEELLLAASELLTVAQDKLGEALLTMIKEEKLILDQEAIYLPPFYYAEIGITNQLLRILREPSHLGFAELKLERIKDLTGLDYDIVQEEAIQTAYESKVMILTGGPGTGKTTTTDGIIKAFQLAGMSIVLAAPTGRAAKRMSESTGLEAKTIHRLLEYKPPNGYGRHDENPIEGDVLIVDEASMIDAVLMNSLLKAVPPHMICIFIGDVDQLPSVGAGNVLLHLIESNVFPVIRLTRIFRQAQSSHIVMNAHAINEGKYPSLGNQRDSDFFFMEASDNESIISTIVDLVARRLPQYYHITPDQIQVLTAMQKGFVGSGTLNLELQKALNEHPQFVRRSGFVFKVGDRVMQIRNNYDKEVFNGDLGYIVAIDMDEQVVHIAYDNRTILYELSELEEVVLAYAITIHKSQGSEFPVVVMPMTKSYFAMLARNLIYTGITRAKKLLVMVGDKKALAYAIRNHTVKNRHSRLKERLRERYEEPR